MKGKYQIKVFYQTGNSFGSEEVTEYLNLTWNDLEVAKQNLIAIKEHYEMYLELDRGMKDCNEVLNSYKDKKWFTGKGDYETRLNIALISDSGIKLPMHVYWCGYFERLHSAEIVCFGDDMKIEF